MIGGRRPRLRDPVTMVTAASQAAEQAVSPAAAGLRETVSAAIADAVADEVAREVVERFGRVAVEEARAVVAEVLGTTDRKAGGLWLRDPEAVAAAAAEAITGEVAIMVREATRAAVTLEAADMAEEVVKRLAPEAVPAARKAVQEALGTWSKREAAGPRGTSSTAARKAAREAV